MTDGFIRPLIHPDVYSLAITYESVDMKIDCHLHLPVKEELTSFAAKKEYLLKELRANNIDYGIVIPDNLEESSIGNLKQCIDLFKYEKSIFLMASPNILNEPISNIHEFDSLLRNSEVVALKIFPGHDEHFPNDIRLIPFIELCLKHNAPFVIHTGWNSGNPRAAKWNDPKYIVELAGKYNQLQIIISHYFWPDIEYCYKITRGYKNIHFDTSGLADDEVEIATGKDKIKEILEKTIADNPKSLLFGSDYGSCALAPHISLIERLNISREAKEQIYSKNAIDLFRLDI